jgi:hypothetical protein
MKTQTRIVLVGVVCAVSFLATPIRAQSCDTTPLFDLNGPTCSVSRQNVECGCSECFGWSPAAGATWYEIRRCDSSGANCTIVGNTRSKNRPAYTDGAGVFHAALQPTIWCVPWDQSFPRIDAAYDYAVRACTDGATGPLCSTQLSNSVRYVAAPYMCIANGIEVACGSISPPPVGLAADLDGDGVIDAIDPDDDGDGISDSADKCPLTVNVGQRDVDRDGVGDACDLEPLDPGSAPADADRDGIGDLLDRCPWAYDPLQADVDRDGIGDACDSCPSRSDPTQSDGDADGQGDVCDLDDGTVFAVWSSRTRLTWAPEAGYTSWCVYRGDLAELKRSRTYTQALGSNPLASRWCSFTGTVLDTTLLPAPGSTAFFLFAGRPGSYLTDLGVDGAGVPRTNANPCP